MSRRTIMALAASVIFGFGFVLTISTDASAYYRGGVYRGGVYRGGVYRGVRPGVAIGIGADRDTIYRIRQIHDLCSRSDRAAQQRANRYDVHVALLRQVAHLIADVTDLKHVAPHQPPRDGQA